MHNDKIISYLSNQKFRGADKGTSKGLIVNSMVDGLQKDSNPYFFSFLPFTFNDDLQIKSLGKEIVMYDPKNVPDGDKMEWKSSNENRAVVNQFSLEIVQKLLLNTELVVSHNASFHHHFLAKAFGKAAFRSVPFGCTMRGINFPKRGINTLALEFIAYKYDFWYNQAEETSAIFKILTLDDNFSELVERLFLSSNTVTLKNTSFSDKEKIKALGYSWNPDGKNWYKNGVEDASNEEEAIRNAGVFCSVDVTPVAPEDKFKTEGM